MSEKSFKRAEILDLEDAISIVLKEDVPCKYALSKTLRKASKENKETLKRRGEIFDKHVKKIKGTPKLKKEAQPGPTGYLITDYEFKDEKEFISEMNGMLSEEVKVEIHEVKKDFTILLSVKEGAALVRKEYTLENYLDVDSSISELAISLLSDVFIK
jgi:predicted acetyltransferase